MKNEFTGSLATEFEQENSHFNQGCGVALKKTRFADLKLPGAIHKSSGTEKPKKAAVLSAANGEPTLGQCRVVIDLQKPTHHFLGGFFIVSFTWLVIGRPKPLD